MTQLVLTIYLALAAFMPSDSDSLRANYLVPQSVDYSIVTKAPKGYKPVYISHYARHGARFRSHEEDYLKLIVPLAKADSAGNLTTLGKEFFKSVSDFYLGQAKDRAGELTPIGWNQHKEIARQIFLNYPDFFRHHPDVHARATRYQRCIVSMSSFCVSLQKCDPKMDIFAEFNNRYSPQLFNEHSKCEYVEPDWDYHAKDCYKSLPYSRILDRIFVDPSKIDDGPGVAKCVYDFVRSVNCVDPDADFDALGLLDHSDMEGYYRAEASRLFEGCYVRQKRAVPVARGIVDDANAALASGEYRMDLRFGHDVVLLALLPLLNIDHFGDMPSSRDDAYKTFRIHRIPMAATLLLVFYRKGDSTIVKILLDGKECVLPLKPVEGPFYDWNELQSYFRTATVS